MKKSILSLAISLLALGFTACEDVPAPYEVNDSGNNTSGVLLEESFSTSLGDFAAINTVGNYPWTVSYSCAQVTSYTDDDGDGTKENNPAESWLISPQLDLTQVQQAYISFDYILRYANASELKTNYQLLISSDYSNSPATATWTALDYNLVQGSDWDNWYNSGKVSIPEAYIGQPQVTIALCYKANAKAATWEVKNFRVAEGAGDSGNGGSSAEATGDGTEANPYNSVAANQYASSLADGEESPVIYIKGKVVSITEQYSTQYGNATFYISDDGTSNGQFYVYRTLYLGNQKYTSGDELKVGDEVVVCGSVTNYMGNTPETVQGKSYLYSLNGKTVAGGGEGGGTTEGEATGDGTEANPFNSVAAKEYASALASGAESDKDVYIKGKVVSIKEQYGTQYGNATFYISDDGTSKNQFYVFRALYLDNQKYTSGTLLQAGDDVVICGRVTNYMGNTPETVQGKAWLVSLKSNGGTGEGGGEGGGTDIGDPSESNGDFENWTGGKPNNWSTTSTAGNATLSQSTDAHGGKYAVEVGGTSSANKRLGYREMTLPAGTYTMKFYTKAATAAGGSVRPGYVPVTDGKVGNYVYGDYTNDLTQSSWVLVTHEFTLNDETTLCLVVMNSKKPGANVLIDDFTLTDAAGNVYIK